MDSDLDWGLILYGEEEEKVMAASKDPIISNLWEVFCLLENKAISKNIFRCNS